MSGLSHRLSEPAYYIEDCRISKQVTVSKKILKIPYAKIIKLIENSNF